MIVIIDNAHGVNTAGKCSPDKQLLEYKWAREIAKLLQEQLKAHGVEAIRIVTEDTDISLKERCNRANALCNKYGTANCIFVSIHSNAAGGDGRWKTAGGWCVYTSPGITKADALATCLWNAANTVLAPYAERFRLLQAKGEYDRKQVPFRADWSDGDPDYEAKFTVLTGTKCPAVLTESLFQDNKSDKEYLLSEEGKAAIVKLHVEGILNYIKSVAS